MSTYARGWMFGALCAMSALGGGWVVAATLSRSGPEFDTPTAPDVRSSRVGNRAPSDDRSMPSMSDRLYFNEHPRLITC